MGEERRGKGGGKGVAFTYACQSLPSGLRPYLQDTHAAIPQAHLQLHRQRLCCSVATLPEALHRSEFMQTKHAYTIQTHGPEWRASIYCRSALIALTIAFCGYHRTSSRSDKRPHHCNKTNTRNSSKTTSSTTSCYSVFKRRSWLLQCDREG